MALEAEALRDRIRASEIETHSPNESPPAQLSHFEQGARIAKAHFRRASPCAIFRHSASGRIFGTARPSGKRIFRQSDLREDRAGPATLVLCPEGGLPPRRSRVEPTGGSAAMEPVRLYRPTLSLNDSEIIRKTCPISDTQIDTEGEHSGQPEVRHERVLVPAMTLPGSRKSEWQSGVHAGGVSRCHLVGAHEECADGPHCQWCARK